MSEVKQLGGHEVAVIESPYYDVYVMKEFGPGSRFDAAHVFDMNGGTIAAFEDPVYRIEKIDWDEGKEKRFRQSITEVVLAFDHDEREPDSLLFDPGRDNQTERYFND